MDNRELANVIEMAIKKEEEARAFYLDLRKKVKDKFAKDTLKYLAEEEAKHAKYLKTCMAGRYCASVLGMKDAVDYKIIEHLEKPDIKKNMNSAEVYLIAAQRELNAFNFYKGLADTYPPGDMKDLLMQMARQEKLHKEKVEYLYDNTAFPQTSGG